MGREVKRVPIGFDWPLNKVWWGYLLESIPCQTCGGIGKVSKPIIVGWKREDGSWYSRETEFCPTCEGEGKAWAKVEIPTGPGYQLWETTSDGSPLSPAFKTPEELARWLADNNASTFGRMTTTYENWLAFIEGPGESVGMVMEVGKGLKSGVEAAVEEGGTNETG